MENKKKKSLNREIVLEKVNAEVSPSFVKITGPKGEITKRITTKRIIIALKDNKITIVPKSRSSKNEKALINSLVAHIKNMIKGVEEEYVYKLKVCASHFPMSVKMKGSTIEVTNYLGEKIPRVLKIKPGVEVKVEGDIITVKSCDKELAGQTASDIEHTTKRPDFDRRVFMDGIYTIEKAGEKLK